MDTSLKTVDVITLFITDLERSKAFYSEVFELPMVFGDDNSAVFRFDNLMINLLLVSHAPELVEPLAVASTGAGAQFMITVPVTDVDVVCAELANRGARLLNGPMDRPWGIRTAAFADPDGHVWELAHDLT